MSNRHEEPDPVRDDPTSLPQQWPGDGGNPTATLSALLADLTQLRDYLQRRGRHTYELAQRFMHNAQRDPAARAYDERQAAMLGYQHYIWLEIAGLVNKLLVTYGDPDAPGDVPGDVVQPDGMEGE